jgi:hypothetical protein
MQGREISKLYLLFLFLSRIGDIILDIPSPMI